MSAFVCGSLLRACHVCAGYSRFRISTTMSNTIALYVPRRLLFFSENPNAAQVPTVELHV
jgi:hypothetical protein